jgi:hypothetical protein
MWEKEEGEERELTTHEQQFNRENKYLQECSRDSDKGQEEAKQYDLLQRKLTMHKQKQKPIIHNTHTHTNRE